MKDSVASAVAEAAAKREPTVQEFQFGPWKITTTKVRRERRSFDSGGVSFSREGPKGRLC